MIELSDIEIDAVSGGMGFNVFLLWANALVEFGSGFIDGINAATQ